MTMQSSIHIDPFVFAVPGGALGAPAVAEGKKPFLARIPLLKKIRKPAIPGGDPPVFGDGGSKKKKEKKEDGGKMPKLSLKRTDKDKELRDLSRFYRHEVRRLRDAIGGKDPLYEHPWYLLIGESESGKSSLAASSSLLNWSERYAAQYRGARFATWWCSNEGIVIDVAGEYILRPDGASDARGWRRLISLMRRYRYRRPVDGVIVTIPGTSLIGPDALSVEELGRRGAAVGEKLRQLVDAISMVVPIYIVITKCDTLTGFGSFTERLPERLQSDMFGWSNPYSIESEYASNWTGEAFQSVLDVIYPTQLEMLSVLDDDADGDDLFLFPSEFQMLLPGAEAYIDAIFRAGMVDTRLLMRGLYFSGDAPEAAQLLAPDEPIVAPYITGVAGAETLAGGLPVNGGGNGKSGNGTNGNGANGKGTNGANGHAKNGAAAALDGKEAGDGEIEPERHVRFTSRLFFEKIFREGSLALPISKVSIAANRGVLATQIGIVLVLLVSLAAMAIEYPRLEDAFEEAHALMDTVHHDLHAAQLDVTDVGENRYIRYVDYAENLFDGMMRFENIRLHSPLFPSSWFGNLHDSIDYAMGRAFTLIIMKAMHAQLAEKTRQLRLYEYRAIPYDSVDAVTFAIDQTYEFRNLRNFTDEMRELDHYIAVYNSLGRSQKIEDVADLVYFLFGRRLPKSFLEDANHYRSALEIPDTLKFDVETHSSEVRHTTQVLLGRLERRIFDNNIVLVNAKGIVADLAYLQGSGAGGFEIAQTMRKLSGRIETLQSALGDTSTAWIGRPYFTPDIALADLLGDIDSSDFMINARPGDTFSLACSTRFVEMKHELSLQVSDAVGGPILDADLAKSRLHTVPLLDTLRSSIDELLAQRFMAARHRDRLVNRRSEATRVFWGGEGLAAALKLADGYTNYAEEGLSRFPQKLQGSASRAMRTGLDASVVSAINPAQRVERNDGTLEGTKREIHGLQSASPQLVRLVGVLDGLQLPASAELNGILRMQCDGMLRDLSIERDQFGVYTIDDSRVRQWERDPDKPFGLTVFDGDQAAIGDKLASDRQFVQELADQSAEPVLSFIAQLGGSRSNAADEWRKIILELKRHDNKAPGNSVATIESFFLGLSDIDEENYRERLEKMGTSNYFLRRREIVRRMLDSVFTNILAIKAAYRYADLREMFNGGLLGRYPFADYTMHAAKPPGSISLIELQHFFHTFDLFNTKYETIWRRWGRDSATYSQKNAYRFLDSLRKVRGFLSPLLDVADTEKAPEMQIEVDLRSNQIKEIGGRDIIGWTLHIGEQELGIQEYVRQGGLPWRTAWRVGDRIRLSLRWAGNSSVTPKDVLVGSGRVSNRMVEYNYNLSAWSLIHLISVHKAPSNHVERNVVPHVLEFSIGTVPVVTAADAVTHYATPQLSEARVFMRMTVINKNRRDAMTMPVFPTTEAPEL